MFREDAKKVREHVGLAITRRVWPKVRDTTFKGTPKKGRQHLQIRTDTNREQKGLKKNWKRKLYNMTQKRKDTKDIKVSIKSEKKI